MSPSLDCWIWGTNGRISISWDTAKHCEHTTILHKIMIKYALIHLQQQMSLSSLSSCSTSVRLLSVVYFADFVVQRYLKHFEHPSLHHAVGTTQCLALWIECIQFGTQYTGVLNPLVDVSVADALLACDGTSVEFKAVPLISSRVVAATTNATTIATSRKNHVVTTSV